MYSMSNLLHSLVGQLHFKSRLTLCKLSLHVKSQDTFASLPNVSAKLFVNQMQNFQKTLSCVYNVNLVFWYLFWMYIFINYRAAIVWTVERDFSPKNCRQMKSCIPYYLFSLIWEVGESNYVLHNLLSKLNFRKFRENLSFVVKHCWWRFVFISEEESFVSFQKCI